jgi:hypothetical protein
MARGYRTSQETHGRRWNARARCTNLFETGWRRRAVPEDSRRNGSAMTKKLLAMEPLKDLVDNIENIVRMFEQVTGKKATEKEIADLRAKIERRAIEDSERARKH